jgi:hypothetical protein
MELSMGGRHNAAECNGDLTKRNFWGTAKKLTAYLFIGGSFLSPYLIVGDRQLASKSEQPYFDSHRLKGLNRDC